MKTPGRMPAPTRLKQGSDSPISRGLTYKDRIYWYMRTVDWDSLWLEATDLPIRVLWAGSSVWVPGNYWERTGSTHLGIELITRGQLHLHAGGKQWRVGEGEICILGKGSSYRYSTGDCRFLNKRFVALDGSIVDSMFASGLLGTSPVIKPSGVLKVVGLLKRLNALLRDKPPSFYVSASAVAYELLLELQLSVRHSWPTPVEQTVRFILHNIHRPFTNAELAASAGVSISHLSLLFRDSLGCSPMQYCVGRKTAAAQHLLKYSDKSIKEIARLVGYDDQLHFSRSFRRHYGCSPRDFRKGVGSGPK